MSICPSTICYVYLFEQSGLIETINDRHKTSTNPFKHQFQDDGRKPRTDLPISWVDCKLRCDMRGNQIDVALQIIAKDDLSCS